MQEHRINVGGEPVLGVVSPLPPGPTDSAEERDARYFAEELVDLVANRRKPL